jgi:hypothetical protein
MGHYGECEACQTFSCPSLHYQVRQRTTHHGVLLLGGPRVWVAAFDKYEKEWGYCRSWRERVYVHKDAI